MSRLERRPKHGAIPIPYTTPMVNGRPDFKSTDPKAHNLCVKYKLCGVCGEWIAHPPYVFGVGPMCVEARFVFGTPMHPGECATAAFRLCPFLSREHWDRTDPADHAAAGRMTLSEEPPPAKPPRAALIHLRRYDLLVNPENQMLYAQWSSSDVNCLEWWSYIDGRLQPEPLPCP